MDKLDSRCLLNRLYSEGIKERGGGWVAAIATFVRYASAGQVLGAVAIGALAWIAVEVAKRDGTLDRWTLLTIAAMIFVIGFVNVKNTKQNQGKTPELGNSNESPQENGATPGRDGCS